MGRPSMVWRDVWNDVRTTEAGHIGAWGVVTRTGSGRREVCTLWMCNLVWQPLTDWVVCSFLKK